MFSHCFIRVHAILCCFLSPCCKITTKGQESIHLPEMNRLLCTGPLFMSCNKPSTQKMEGFIRT